MTKPKILIADDSKLNVEILKNVLDEDYNLSFAFSGKECLLRATEENPDLILLDVVMPDINGYEVCKILKDNVDTQNIPIIFVTSMGNTDDETRGLEVGAIDYIVKPVNPAIVKARVKNHIELKQYRDILENFSMMDGLTGIANRRNFDQTYKREWNKALRNKTLLSMIMIDIDHFKNYNDSYGHVCGDDCLRSVAFTLQASLGELYRVYRYGGEEFVVLLPLMDSRKTFFVAERFRQAVLSLEIPNISSKFCKYITISAGLASIVPDFLMNPLKLIKRADRALYEAKCQGRNMTIDVDEIKE